MINRKDLMSGTRPEVGNRIFITEKDYFEGYQVMEYKGMVWGISMRSKDFLQDSFMGLKQFIGGELTSYTQLSDESRQKALDRLKYSARNLGANAIINFRFEISNAQYGVGNSEVVAYGNAVVIEPIKNYVPMGSMGNIVAEFVDAYLKNNNGSESQNENSQENCNVIIPKIPVAQLFENDNCKYIVCPECGRKYRVIDKNGKLEIAGLYDIDAEEEGMQIHCLKCGTKFTVPQS